MAKQEQVDLLKQGVEVWNKWREAHPGVRPDLSNADLREATLNGANLRGADLSGAKLSGATLFRADLSGADLSSADLRGATLYGANLSFATLNFADLRGATLIEATLNFADLRGADLSGAMFWNTSLGDVDLARVQGLETVKHSGKSYVDIHTLYRSQGKIPEVFLRGIGAPDTFIEYVRSLTIQPIQYYSCFISYSSKDKAFAKRLYADLQSNGVRCWFAPEDVKIGDKFPARIDEAIRVHDKLLLVLSEHSVKSAWVEKEVETAFERERKRNMLVLFPVKLDETIAKARQSWAADIQRMRHIGDFTHWKEHDSYQQAFGRLLHDLKAEPKKPRKPRNVTKKGED